MTKRYLKLCFVVAAALTLGVGEAAVAQDGVITLEETTIKGRPQKPEAFYILQYTNLSYETLNTKPSFVEEIVESVDEEVF